VRARARVCVCAGTPWKSLDLYNKWNPAAHTDKWSTPTLVIHGGMDFRLPVTEGLSAFTALQRRNIPSKLLVFPMENHWVLKPQNRYSPYFFPLPRISLTHIYFCFMCCVCVCVVSCGMTMCWSGLTSGSSSKHQGNVAHTHVIAIIFAPSPVWRSRPTKNAG
jgi:hypothetical protein